MKCGRIVVSLLTSGCSCHEGAPPLAVRADRASAPPVMFIPPNATVTPSISPPLKISVGQTGRPRVECLA